MLKSEVVVGMECMTQVSGNNVRVKVLYEITDRYSHRTKYMVRRVDDGKDLKKPRGPGVLYHIKSSDSHHMKCNVSEKESLDADIGKCILDFLTQPIPSE